MLLRILSTSILSADELPQPLVTQYPEYARVEITLESALPDGKNVTLHFGHHGEGGFLQAWATVDDVKLISDAVDAAELKLKDGTLQGKVAIADLRDGTEAGRAAEFNLDAKVEGQAVRGSYKGWTAVRELGKDNIEYLSDKPAVRPDEVRWSFKKKIPVEGDVSGSMADADAAAKGQTFAEGQDWPQLRGPNDNWSAAPFEGELIDDMTDARLVWKSETTPAARSQVTRYGEGNIVRYLERGLAGGGASPMVADGRVYFQYFKPTGDEVSEGTVKSQIKNDRRTIVDMWKTRATDGVLCLDAATGRTLWKAEIPGGRYYPAMSGRMGSTKGWYAPQPAVADGRLYVTTTADVTHCFDAKTGLTLWKAVLPRRAINWQGDQKANPGNTGCVSDGKVFIVGYAGNLYALNLESGELLWEGAHGGEMGQKLRQARESIRETGAGQPSEKIIGPANSVATYHDGVLLVSSHYIGAVFAYDAATGKPLWREGAELGVRGIVRLIETADGGKHPCLFERAKEDGRYFHRAVVLHTKTGERLIETEIELPKTGDKDNVGGYITWKNRVVALTGLQPGYFHQHNNPAGVAGFKLTEKGFEKIWEHHLDKIGGAPHQLIIMDGRLHLGGHRDNRISNLDVATGKVHPHIPGTDGQGSYMQLTAGYGNLFRPSDQPAMVRADPDAEHVTAYAAAFAHGYLHSTCDITLADGRIFVRTKDGLVCLDLRRPAADSKEERQP